MRRLLAAAALLLAFPAGAAGDGLPMVDYGQRPAAIDTAHGRVVAIPARSDTLVAELTRRSDAVRNSRIVEGRLAVPAVAYDGTPGGLSADGRRITLIKPRLAFPRRSTRFVLLDRFLRPVDEVRLDGDFSFDAISPDGSALFLVEYLDRKDPSVYRVRVYDVAAGRLIGKPLIDSETAAIAMRGLPMTRETVGAREFTLYDGNGKPFVHALDTQQRSALCIPLPSDARRASRLEALGDWLSVGSRDGRTLAWIDTERNVARGPVEGWGAAFTGWLGSALAPRV